MIQRLDERQDYETPPELVAALSAEFGPFEFDFAATEANKKAPTAYTPEMDSLSLVWSGVGWLNPPYGRATKAFVRKASESKARTVCLLPAWCPATKGSAHQARQAPLVDNRSVA